MPTNYWPSKTYFYWPQTYFYWVNTYYYWQGVSAAFGWVHLDGIVFNTS